MEDLHWPSVASFTLSGQSNIVLICEHASADIPPDLQDLGLDQVSRHSHAAWDIGALEVAKRLSSQLDAPLVAGQVSRLVYDCNRPLDAPDCIPAKSEVHEIPGNRALDAQARQIRFDRVHSPFHAEVSRVIEAQETRCQNPLCIVTIHSFTPVFHGKIREIELGLLFHENGALTKATLAQAQAKGQMKTAINEPYSATDGVTYSLQKHAEARGLHSLMIEIRNDLIDTTAKAQGVADHLAELLTKAVATLGENA